MSLVRLAKPNHLGNTPLIPIDSFILLSSPFTFHDSSSINSISVQLTAGKENVWPSTFVFIYPFEYEVGKVKAGMSNGVLE